MNPYLFTITFLALMGMLTSSEMVRHHADSFEKECYKSSCHYLVAAEEARVLSQIEELRRETNNTNGKGNDTDGQPEPPLPPEPKQSKPKHAKALGINFARPPNNSRLNLYFLLGQKTHNDLPTEFSLYQVTARLIHSLYRDEAFYIPEIEYRLLDKLIKIQEKTAFFTNPDQLADLDLEDPLLQKIFHLMLKGTRTAHSLLNYITFDQIESEYAQFRKINFLFADSLILHAIFPEEYIANELIQLRDQLLEEIAYQETMRLQLPTTAYKGRKPLSNELKKILENTLNKAGKETAKYLGHVFDCTIGHPGTVLFIENSQTHVVTREKYIPARK